MRILYLHQPYSAPSGAVSTRAHAMASALAAAGHEVTLACGRHAGARTGLDGPFRLGRRMGEVPGGFRVVEVAVRSGTGLSVPARALSFAGFAAAAGGLALGHWDGIIASSTPLSVALPALLARGLRRTPFLFEIRDPWPELPRAMTDWLRATDRGRGVPGWMLAAMGPLATRACQGAAAVVALSDGMAATAVARGADPSRVTVIPNGCDLDLFGPQVPPRRDGWRWRGSIGGRRRRGSSRRWRMPLPAPCPVPGPRPHEWAGGARSAAGGRGASRADALERASAR
jgi:glycosyltransferase involved in cell wall biosynthesis